jgi:hypothetical protein
MWGFIGLYIVLEALVLLGNLALMEATGGIEGDE